MNDHFLTGQDLHSADHLILVGFASAIIADRPNQLQGLVFIPDYSVPVFLTCSGKKPVLLAEIFRETTMIFLNLVLGSH